MKKKQLIRLLSLSILVIALGAGVFLFLKGFFESSATTLTQEILAAVLGTVMLMVVTSLLLNAQSAAEEGKQKSLGIFEHKLKIYGSFLDVLYSKIEDGCLDSAEIKELMGWMTKISLIAGVEASSTISSFVQQCLLVNKFRYIDLTDDEINLWREWYREHTGVDPAKGDEDFVSVGRVVMELRQDLGEFRVSDEDQSIMSLVVVDELVGSIRQRRIAKRKGAQPA